MGRARGGLKGATATATGAATSRRSAAQRSSSAAVSTPSAPSAAAPSVELYDEFSSTSGRQTVGDIPDFDGLLVEFPRDLNEYEQGIAKGIVCYLCFLPTAFNGTDDNRWLSPRHFWIDANSRRSRSSDWRAHDPFGDLTEYLVSGTPERKRQQNTRKWHGVGVAPARFILGHPGDRPPLTPASSRDSEDRRPRGLMAGLASPYDLLGVRGHPGARTRQPPVPASSVKE